MIFEKLKSLSKVANIYGLVCFTVDVHPSLDKAFQPVGGTEGSSARESSVSVEVFVHK